MEKLFDEKKPKKTRRVRAAVRSGLWPQGIIPYIFSDSGKFTTKDKNEIYAAMR